MKLMVLVWRGFLSGYNNGLNLVVVQLKSMESEPVTVSSRKLISKRIVVGLPNDGDSNLIIALPDFRS